MSAMTLARAPTLLAYQILLNPFRKPAQDVPTNTAQIQLTRPQLSSGRDTDERNKSGDDSRVTAVGSRPLARQGQFALLKIKLAEWTNRLTRRVEYKRHKMKWCRTSAKGGATDGAGCGKEGRKSSESREGIESL